MLNILWRTDETYRYTEESLHAPHITLWRSFTSEITVDPFFFFELLTRIGRKTFSDNRKRCLEMVGNKVMPCLLEHNVFHKVIFVQDDALLHIAIKVMQLLKTTFSYDHLIGKKFRHE